MGRLRVGEGEEGMDEVRLSPTGLFRNICGVVCVCCVGVCDGAYIDLWRLWLGGGEGTLAQQAQQAQQAPHARLKRRVHVVPSEGQSPMRLYFSPLPACVTVSCQIETMRGEALCCRRMDTCIRSGRSSHEPSGSKRGGEDKVLSLGSRTVGAPSDDHLKLCAFE